MREHEASLTKSALKEVKSELKGQKIELELKLNIQGLHRDMVQYHLIIAYYIHTQWSFNNVKTAYLLVNINLHFFLSRRELIIPWK